MSFLDNLNPGAVLGGLLGFAGSSGNQTQTVNKDPWGPAQPYLLNNLQTLSDLQKFYQANPMNAQQQQAYQNIINNNNWMNNNVGPGLMNFAGALAQQQYQRQTGGRPGDAAGYGGPRQAPQQFNPWSAFMQGAGQRVAPQTVDFNAMNPYASFIPQLQAQRTPPAAPVSNPSSDGLLATDRGGNARSPDTGWDRMTPQEKATWLADNPTVNAIDGLVNGLVDSSPLLTGLLTAAGDNGDRTWVRMAADSIGPSKDGDNPGPNNSGYNPARDSNQASIDSEKGYDRGGNAGGGSRAGGYGGVGHDPGEGRNYGDRGDRGDGGFAKGGMVKKKHLTGPDPKGPDEGKANLQSGEYVIRKAAVKKVGKGLLDVINKA